MHHDNRYQPAPAIFFQKGDWSLAKNLPTFGPGVTETLLDEGTKSIR